MFDTAELDDRKADAVQVHLRAPRRAAHELASLPCSTACAIAPC
jgi:hypothetical protein